MKANLFILLFVLNTSRAYTQQIAEDSVRAIINLGKQDTAEINALIYLSSLKSNTDSQISYSQQALSLARRIKYENGEADGLLQLSDIQRNFLQRIQFALEALSIYENINDKTGMASAHLVLQSAYREAGDYHSALIHAFPGAKIAEANNVRGKLDFPGQRLAPLFFAEIGQTYLLENKLDSAAFFTNKSIGYNETFQGTQWSFPIYLLATIQTHQSNYKLALENFRRAISLSIQNGNPGDTIQIFSGMSTLFLKTNVPDSAIYYAGIVAKHWNNESEIKNLLEALNNLAFAYKLKGEKDSAIKYIELSQITKDSVLSRSKDRELQNITFNEQLKQQKLIAAQAKYKNNVQLYTLLSGMFMLLLVAAILWRNNQHRQKAFILLEQQKQETDIQKSKVENTLEELKTTQAQLIQSEKMASLGELTAGIAHEIQNPLNFVNNFSDINKELLEELKDEADKGNVDEVKAIAIDVIENEQKINLHGRRADSIVKSMLQHSSTTKGEKQLTNINTLVEEYLRLAYHGYRAKDKSFNVTLKTDFDTTIGNINIVPQEIGRVLLNLFNNAFYALHEQLKKLGNSYEPAISVSTRKVNDKIEIRVQDNGMGVSKSLQEKIFQPFFTTKPTGEGTGLGLSLSYDIVKAHGGELKVESTENEGSLFIITIPTL